MAAGTNKRSKVASLLGEESLKAHEISEAKGKIASTKSGTMSDISSKSFQTTADLSRGDVDGPRRTAPEITNMDPDQMTTRTKSTPSSSTAGASTQREWVDTTVPNSARFPKLTEEEEVKNNIVSSNMKLRNQILLLLENCDLKIAGIIGLILQWLHESSQTLGTELGLKSSVITESEGSSDKIQYSDIENALHRTLDTRKRVLRSATNLLPDAVPPVKHKPDNRYSSPPQKTFTDESRPMGSPPGFNDLRDPNVMNENGHALNENINRILEILSTDSRRLDLVMDQQRRIDDNRQNYAESYRVGSKTDQDSNRIHYFQTNSGGMRDPSDGMRGHMGGIRDDMRGSHTDRAPVRYKQSPNTDRRINPRAIRTFAAKAILGELAYQLEMRILVFVFPNRKHFFGLTLRNVANKILDETDAIEKDLQRNRYMNLMEALKPCGYKSYFHSDFIDLMIKTYGTFPDFCPSKAIAKEHALDHADILRGRLEELSPPHQLQNVMIIYHSLAFLAKRDRCSLFLW